MNSQPDYSRPDLSSEPVYAYLPEEVFQEYRRLCEQIHTPNTVVESHRFHWVLRAVCVLVFLMTLNANEWTAFLCLLVLIGSFFIPPFHRVIRHPRNQGLADLYYSVYKLFVGIKKNAEGLIQEALNGIGGSEEGMRLLVRSAKLKVEERFWTPEELVRLSQLAAPAQDAELTRLGELAAVYTQRLQRLGNLLECVFISDEYGQPSPLYQRALAMPMSQVQECLDDYDRKINSGTARLQIDPEALFTACAAAHLCPQTRQECVDRAADVLRSHFYARVFPVNNPSDESPNEMLLSLAVTARSGQEALEAQRVTLSRWFASISMGWSSTLKLRILRQLTSALCLLQMETLEHSMLVSHSAGLVLDEDMKRRLQYLGGKRQTHSHVVWVQNPPALQEGGLLCEYRSLQWRGAELDALFNEIHGHGKGETLRYSLLLREHKHTITLPDSAVRISSSDIARRIADNAGSSLSLLPRVLQAVDGSGRTANAFCLSDGGRICVCAVTDTAGASCTFTFYTVYCPDAQDSLPAQHTWAKVVQDQSDPTLNGTENRMRSAMLRGLDQSIQFSIDAWRLNRQPAAQTQPAGQAQPAGQTQPQDDDLY